MEPSLWLYAVVVFGIVLLPGLDMAFVMASAVAGGRRNGVAALGGIVLGGVFHVLMGALGVAAVLRVVPMAFNLVLLAGAAYIGWIGVSLIRSKAASTGSAATATPSRRRTFSQGLVTCLLNPKAYLFTLAVLPPFVVPGSGPFGWRIAAIGAITALAQVVVYGAIALAGDRLRDTARRRPGASLVATRAVGVLLVAMGLYSAFMGWRGV